MIGMLWRDVRLSLASPMALPLEGGCTDLRRKRSDLRERQGQQLLGHTLGMIMRLTQTLLGL